MNYFDIIVAIPLLWAVYKGFRKGLIIEIASLVALVLGTWGGLNFSNYASELISGNAEVSSRVLPLLSFALTFIAIVIVVFLLAKMLERVIKMAALGIANRIFGALFGLLKVLLICSVLVYLVDTADKQYGFISGKFREESVLYGPLSKIAPTIMPLFKEWQTERYLP